MGSGVHQGRGDTEQSALDNTQRPLNASKEPNGHNPAEPALGSGADAGVGEPGACPGPKQKGDLKMGLDLKAWL
ncbi:hypothetical protein Y1Q_0024321 [Alligator mississippiensis]|uniref:Uncharacterized protein n=1 Tax=Alligator mississippiensis TaxID=8496 RepID=A0A151NIJ9_ALLMI|nr:hypothetical protein Y1Q_0024321 [Alligator mississippiensis]